MINPFEIIETINMIDKENLDIRTITMGISLKSCAGPDIDVVCGKVYKKITTLAKDLVKVGGDIETQFGIPIINKRISVTPVATLVDALDEPTVEKAVMIAKTLDKAAKTVGVDFIGGYSALVHKGYTEGEKVLIKSIPRALRRHTRRNKYGRGEADGRNREGGGSKDSRHARLRVREARRVLQRRRGQSVHGGRVPRRGRGRMCDKRRRFGTGRCEMRA